MKYLWLAQSLLAASLLALPAAAQDNTVNYKARDFSALLKPRTQFLGYQGANYQKLDVVFLSVARDPAGDYKVNGYILLKGRQTPFSGTLSVEKIELLSMRHFGVDSEFKGSVKVEGILHGRYLFSESDGSALDGAMTLAWYIDGKGRLLYDDIDMVSDGYSNNQYKGRWSLGDQAQTANWGEYRIPDSKELDIGAGEFSANPKFKANGW